MRSLPAQPAPLPYVFIDKISVEGNKKTRTSVILRELLFEEGDTVLLEQLDEVLERSKQQMLNTGLFNEADIIFKDWKGVTNRIHLHIKVRETWYLYPVPIFELADRNFNVWWVDQNRSLERVNFGIEFTHLNTTGRRDKLQLTAKYGYTRNYRLKYSLPYLNAAQTLGFIGEVSFARNKEVNYVTLNNKQAFHSNENNQFIYQRFRTETGLTIRPGLRTNHLFVLGYRQNTVADIVAQELNPDFFLQQRNLQRFFSLSYLYSFENRDVRFYPWKGNYFSFLLEKDGLGIFEDRNALTTGIRYDHHLPFSQRWSLALSWRGKVSLLRQQQPYNDNRALGFFGNTPRGFEYYVIDGLDMGLFKSSLHWQLFQAEINVGKIMPIEAFQQMPIKLFLSFNNDLGYVNDPFASPDNHLSNHLLWGGGLGLDVVLFYDKVFRLEYSFNHLMENGLFLHLDMNI